MSTTEAQPGVIDRSPRDNQPVTIIPGGVFFCLLLMVFWICPCQAADNNRLIAEILTREISLQKLNKEIHLQAANPSFARARRNWFYDTGNALSTEAGLIDAVALFFEHANDKILNQVEVEKKNGQTRFKDTLYGPTKLAQATIGTAVAFRTRANATSDNQLSAAANLTYCSGQAFNITELLRERIVDEVRHRADKDKGLLPVQRIQSGLQNLDHMESTLKML